MRQVTMSAYSHIVISLLVLIGLSGCATYNPNDYYDPNAMEKMGRIVEKQITRAELKDSAELRVPILLPIMVNGTMHFLRGSYTRAPSQVWMDVYEYRVGLPGDQTVSVISEYPSFQVGECAKVFFSTRPSYPRIAPGYDCSN